MDYLSKLKKHEKASLSLRALYDSYGYRRYRMGNFEEYSFYMENKDFLQSEKIITFNDINGRLMALKPDVTLSIVKNAKKGDRFYYIENVYRPSAQNVNYKEIEQMGLENIGEIDLYTECEVAFLAAQSLSIIDEKYVLDISHMGLINLLCDTVADKGTKSSLMKCLSGKNLHEAEEIFGDNELLKAVFKGDLAEIEKLNIEKAVPFVAELRFIVKFLADNGVTANVDFSLVNDEGYYNGIIFRGYVEKVPRPILSGGRYDKLMEKLNKNCGGLGFAVYLDELGCYDEKPEYDCDAVLIADGENVDVIFRAAAKLRAEGKSVRVESSSNNADVRYATTYTVKNGITEVNNA